MLRFVIYSEHKLSIWLLFWITVLFANSSAYSLVVKINSVFLGFFLSSLQKLYIITRKGKKYQRKVSILFVFMYKFAVRDIVHHCACLAPPLMTVSSGWSVCLFAIPSQLLLYALHSEKLRNSKLTLHSLTQTGYQLPILVSMLLILIPFS